MLPQAIEVDLSAYLTFLGHIADNEDHLLVVGPAGEVRIEGNRAELRAVRNLILGLDGFTALGSLIDDDSEVQTQHEDVLDALSKVGALLDQARGWHWYHEVSSNPPPVPLGHDPMGAYSLPRLAVTGNPCSTELDRLGGTEVDALACARRSADLCSATMTPHASLRSAIRLAANVYIRQPDGRRPVAAAGALYPLHFWIVGSSDLGTPRQILAIDHDQRTMTKSGEIGLKDLQDLFVPDPDVAGALDRGAAVIVVAADPSRVTQKYGNRGWRYTLMECGAVMHHITLSATSRKEKTRPIGGYFDALLQRAICDPALPLLTIFVMAEQ